MPEDVTLNPHEIKVITVGFSAEIRSNEYLRFSLRSSSNKLKLRIPGSVSDTGFTGALGFCLENISEEPVYINKGERLVQIIYEKINSCTRTSHW